MPPCRKELKAVGVLSYLMDIIERAQLTKMLMTIATLSSDGTKSNVMARFSVHSHHLHQCRSIGLGDLSVAWSTQ
jgi:hypothetical protein